MALFTKLFPMSDGEKMRKLQRTEFALSQVKAHLANLTDRAPEIENFLTQYLAVAFYSEREEHVKRVYKDRLHFKGDSRLEFFVSKTNEKMMSRVKKSEIIDLVKLFGGDCEDIFKRELENQDLAAYSSIISNRHNVAHGAGGTLTLNDVERAVKAADRVLDSLKNAIQ